MFVDSAKNEPLLEKERTGFVDAKVAIARRFHSKVQGCIWESSRMLAGFV